MANLKSLFISSNVLHQPMCPAIRRISTMTCAVACVLTSLSAPAQNLFVDSYHKGTILEIAADGTQSTFYSGLTNPQGMAFDSAGNLYVAQVGTGTVGFGSIIKISPGGTTTTVASGLNMPRALAFDNAGNLYVDSFSDGTICKITPAGVLSTFYSGLTNPEGMSFDSAGNLYVSAGTSGSIYKIAPNGSSTVFASGLQYPCGIAINQQDDIFTAEATLNDNITEFRPDGPNTSVGSGLINLYNCLAFDSGGNLFAGEWGTGIAYDGTIVKITPGGVQTTIATGLFSPTSIAIQVPEPSALGLVAFGAAAFFICLRRKFTTKRS
jgi:sugar lactone lactonase YvrE